MNVQWPHHSEKKLRAPFLPASDNTSEALAALQAVQTCITDTLLGLRHLTQRNIVCIKGTPAISLGFLLIPFIWW